ncbi:MAG: flagellar motor switch protein FliN [Candidatus Goldbacteria bacterium]|nr:flagellar motor switch protein FliN [Candidatus Goldiibacteriota bacterium]
MALQQNEKNNVTEILNQAIQNGQNMIAELLGKEVTISVTNIDSIDASDLNSIFPGKNVVAPMEISEGLGIIALILSENIASVMADLMIGQDGTNPPTVLEDLHLSAITELTNQVIDSIVGNVSSQLAKSMLTTPLEVTSIDLSSSVIPGIDGTIILLEGDISISNLGNGKIGVVFSGESVDIIKQGPKAESSAAGFVSDITAGGKIEKTTASAQNIVTSELQEEKNLTVYDKSLDIVMDVPLTITVELGRTEKLVRDVLEMSPGSVIELDKLAGEPVDILVNQKYIAKGEVVVIDENFGIRITDIIRPADRIPKL